MSPVKGAAYTQLNSGLVRKTSRKPLRLLTCVLWSWWGLDIHVRSTARKSWRGRQAGWWFSWESKKRWPLWPFHGLKGQRLHGYFLWCKHGKGAGVEPSYRGWNREGFLEGEWGWELSRGNLCRIIDKPRRHCLPTEMTEEIISAEESSESPESDLNICSDQMRAMQW